MKLFKKKDRRYNTQFDNYTDKYSDTFKLGLAYVAIFIPDYLHFKTHTNATEGVLNGCTSLGNMPI